MKLNTNKCLLVSLALIILFLSQVSAQQSLFNVPSSDITPSRKPFFQQQFNIGEGLLQLNSTFSYGLGKNTEIGLNVLGLNVNEGSGSPFFMTNGNLQASPVYPFYTLNFQKAFVINDYFKLALGTQTGFAQGGHFGTYDYLNFVTIIPKHKSKIISGIYYGSDSFLGPEDRIDWINGYTLLGYQIGLEQPIIEDKLLFIAENISGLHNLGETTLGGAYYVSDHWVLSAGFQFSNPGSKTPEALVVEFTYVPSASQYHLIHKHGHQ
jgi:hypothetical protein